jgi:hypothetical protein
MQFLLARFFLKKIKFDQSNPITIIDTFLYANSFRGGAFYDKHFVNLFNYLTSQEILTIRYFPTFYKVKNYFSVIYNLRKFQNLIFIKENFLALGDYFFIFDHWFKILKFYLIDSKKFNKVKNLSLLREDLVRGLFCASSIEALLKYRAIKRMSHGKPYIGSILEWYENQDIDRAACLGYKTFFPDVRVIGYAGYVPARMYLGVYPTDTEWHSKVLPHQIVVTGPALVPIFKQFCSLVSIIHGPALRYSFGKVIQFNKSERLNILVALPIHDHESIHILNLVSSFIEKLNVGELSKIIHLSIKSHPSGRRRHVEFINKNHVQIIVNWVEGEFIPQDLVICAASSAALEALVVGSRVVIIGSANGLTMNTIPDSLLPDNWRVCYSSYDLSKAIKDFYNDLNANSTEKFDSKAMQDLFFSSTTRDSIRHLIGFIK